MVFVGQLQKCRNSTENLLFDYQASEATIDLMTSMEPKTINGHFIPNQIVKEEEEIKSSYFLQIFFNRKRFQYLAIGNFLCVQLEEVFVL